MTRLEKLTKAEKEILDLRIGKYPNFFTQVLPEKMEEFLSLCYFNEADIDSLHHYFRRFIALYKLDIDWSRKMKKEESEQWQDSFLKTCKDQTHNLLSVIVMGFEHMEESKERLHTEEN